MSTDAAELSSLKQCPICGYALEGLPSEYRCPECFFEYDGFTRVWRPRRRPSSAALLVFYLVMLVVLGLRLLRNPTDWCQLVCSLVVAVTVPFTYFELRRNLQ